MPLIKPFSALIPADHLQSVVVTRPLEYYSTGEAKLIASENNFSFLHLIDPFLDHPYLRDAYQDLIFRKVSENLNSFIAQSVLINITQPSYYIYQVISNDLIQVGLWTLSDINSYLDGSIKKHELTVKRREKQLADYLQHTGLDANPVLITYYPNAIIEALIKKYIKEKPIIDFVFSDKTEHRIWAIDCKADIELITEVFEKMESVYIADGHHRAAAMTHRRHFSTVYMNTNEIRIFEFNRLVRDLNGLDNKGFLVLLEKSFVLRRSDAAVVPEKFHEIGMYIDFQWYLLTPKDGTYADGDPVEMLDVSILQNQLLGPVLGINDPRTDARITFEGGATSVAQLQKMVDNGLYAVAFTLFAVSVEQIIKVADAGEVMPPKSTWIEPKFLVGMLTNYCAGASE